MRNVRDCGKFAHCTALTVRYTHDGRPEFQTGLIFIRLHDCRLGGGHERLIAARYPKYIILRETHDYTGVRPDPKNSRMSEKSVQKWSVCLA